MSQTIDTLVQMNEFLAQQAIQQEKRYKEINEKVQFLVEMSKDKANSVPNTLPATVDKPPYC
jgi:TPP-dependent pyruvate/acetoin dehydrogenase alpha subunit